MNNTSYITNLMGIPVTRQECLYLIAQVCNNCYTQKYIVITMIIGCFLGFFLGYIWFKKKKK